MTRPTFSDKDPEILATRIVEWNARSGPRVGDFAVLLDGRTVRFSHDWGDDMQTTDGRYGASFYFGKDGYMSFSGGLDPAIPKTSFVDTGETRDGNAWIFHNDEVRAHNGVDVNVPCRVFQQIA